MPKIEVFDFTLGDPKEPTPSFIKKALIENIDDISQYPSDFYKIVLEGKYNAINRWFVKNAK
jgi:aspartate/methionine/tyrosine aminotransferase